MTTATVCRWWAGFFEIKAAQSMTRAIAWICALGVFELATAAAVIAVRPVTEIHVSVIKALAAFAGVLLVNGAAAMLLRPRAVDAPDTAPPPPETP